MPGADLKTLRLTAGLTQQEVADQLRELGRSIGPSLDIRYGGTLAADGQMVSKWERGQKRPGPAYRKLLCELFNVPYMELWGALADVGPGLGGDATIRREFLQTVGVGSVALYTAQPGPELIMHKDLDSQILALHRAVRDIERTYEYVEPRRQLPRMEQLQQLAARCLDLPSRPAQRLQQFALASRLASLQANAALNAAQIRLARQLVGEARYLADLCPDPAVAGWAFINASMIELYAGRPAAARDIAIHGQQRVGRGPLSAYLANFEARAHAVLADTPAALRAVGRSYDQMDHLSAAEQGEPGFSMTTYHRADLDCETVTVYALLHRPREALAHAASAHQSIDGLDKSGVRAQVLIPEAAAHRQLGDQDRAADLIRQAHHLTQERRPWWYQSRTAEFLDRQQAVGDSPRQNTG